MLDGMYRYRLGNVGGRHLYRFGNVGWDVSI